MIVGIVPAAGYARRLQPLDVSKEVYPLGGRPVMDYLVERMSAAGCAELRVVTRPEKRDVIEYAEAHGATVIRAHPPSLAQSLAAGIEALEDDDLALFGFPDAIWEPADGYRKLLLLLEAGWDIALGLFEAADLTRYEPVVADESGRVLRIEFKPRRPSSGWIWGCSAAQVRALRGLDEESEPGIYFDRLCRRGVVGGARLGSYLDMGTPEGLAEALAARPG